MANDPLADMQNIIGYQGLVGPNPYLQYQGKIPMAGYYTGDAGNMPPTDATGKPIQSFVDYNNDAQAAYQKALAAYNAQPAAAPASSGKTLDQMIASFTPLQQQWWAGAPANEKQMAMNAYGVGQGAPTAGATPGTTINSAPPNVYGTPTPNLSQGIYSAAPPGGYNLPQGQSIPLSQFAGGTGGGNQNQQDAAGLAALMGLNPQRLNGMGAVYGAPAAAAPARAPPPSPPDLRQAYLSALANPGKPPTYGAAPPGPGQAPTGAQPPSVMNAFLAANKGSNTPFLNTLRGIQNG